MQYRITRDVMVKVTEQKVLSKFAKLSNQYVNENDIHKTILSDIKSLNKLYNETPKREPSPSEYEEMTAQVLKFEFRENLEWKSHILGIALFVKDLTTGDILLSRLVTFQEIKLNSDLVLIDGNFWTGYINLLIPQTPNNLAVNAVTLTFDDIDAGESNSPGTGEIYVDIDQYIPLIKSQPMPDSIVVNASLDDNMFLKFGIGTSVPNESVEKTLINFFGVLPDENIRIEYQIDYGNSVIGYETLKISNGTYTYGPVSFMPNYPKNENINIIVTMNVHVDDKLMQRQISINNVQTTFMERLNQLEDIELNHYVVEHTENTTVKNDLIVQDDSGTPNIIYIQQPVYIKSFQTDNMDIKIDASQRHITFEGISVKDTHDLKLLFLNEKGETVIFLNASHIETNWYFDCTLIEIDSSVTKYEVITGSDGVVHRKGKLEH